MSLDQLISRYLDGELSSGEDIQLRSLLKDSREAKADFDTAVLLNAALREDARSISTPDDLLRDTEDLIMMEIMKDYKAPVTIKRKTRRFAWITEMLQAQTWRPAYNFALTVAAITSIFAISDISDPAFSPVDTAVINKIQIKQANTEIAPKVQSQSFASKTKASATKRTKGIPQAKHGSNVAITTANSEEYAEIIVAKDENTTDVVNTNTVITTTASETQIRIDGIDVSNPFVNNTMDQQTKNLGQGQETATANAIMQSPDAAISSTAKTNAPAKVPTNPIQGNTDYNINNMMKSIATIDDVFHNDEVQLSTFLGSDLYSNGIGTSKKGVSHFSQSVSYSMTDLSRLGMEFGVTQYGYEKLSYIIISGAKRAKTEGYDPIGNESIGLTLPIKINETGEVMWGAIFYETKLLYTDWAELTARGGLGFTGDGPLGYVRLYGKVNLFSGFSLTLGTEAREYSLIINNTGSKYKFSNLLMYGVQFKL